MSNKWKVILGLIVLLSVGGYVMTNITTDEAQKIEEEVNSVHTDSVTLIHIEKIDQNHVLVFYEWGGAWERGGKLAVAELKKNLLGWTFESSLSIGGREERRSLVFNEYAVIVGLALYSIDFHEIKIETADGEIHTARIIENEDSRGRYWFYIASEEESEEIFNAAVYMVTEDGEVIEEIEKPDNDPLY
ncbi:hypothetical protein [Halalkalibacterium halodurans]|jgi:hypothetical protein|uniref:DUF4340 domain-containing protein n=1 Tax=Halalkalibacterium halodurans TaxID=86665 RepID=A0A0M0KGI4_ALKHA|nr:hypothetical protein [Halalkalibacterium halodurans]TPE68357.1 hypothetical protein AMD02_014155 [Halalkalibacterium halodurans]